MQEEAAEKPAQKPPAAKSEPAPEAEAAPVQPPKAQPVKPADIEEIYRNAKPFPRWVEIIDSMRGVSRSIAETFVGSSAYESGSYLLIDVNNDMAFELLRQGNRRREIRELIQSVTGKAYKLGPYKRPQQKEEKKDPMQVFKEKLADSGITVEEG